MDAGVLPSDVVLTFGCATDEPATRLLRVDARGDRLVEADARGRTVRTVDVADVVSFEARAKDDDEDWWDFVDEYARWLDEVAGLDRDLEFLLPQPETECLRVC